MILCARAAELARDFGHVMSARLPSRQYRKLERVRPRLHVHILAVGQSGLVARWSPFCKLPCHAAHREVPYLGIVDRGELDQKPSDF